MNPVPVLTNKLQALTALTKRAGEHTIYTVMKKNHKVKRKKASAYKNAKTQCLRRIY